MAKYTKQTKLFKDISGKKVEVTFDGNQNSSDAGLLLLREIENEIGLISKIANVIRDQRHSGYIQHELIHLLTQRVFQIAAGYEDANDSDTLRHDPIFKMACEKLPTSDQALASQPTISRFENALSRSDLYRIAQAFLVAFIESYQHQPKGIIIDLDDTEDPTHGNQQLSFFNGYYGSYCYQPMHIYEGTSGKLITTILRPGKRPSGKEVIAILKRIVRIIREAWPGVGIIIRGDSHYSSPELHDFCDENDLNYVLGLTGYESFKEKAQPLVKVVKHIFQRYHVKTKRYTEFSYQAHTWSQPQRIIAKVEYTEKGLNTRFVVTNLKNTKRKMLYETIYCGRGAMELMIKEHKNHLASDRTSCSRFEANQFRVFLHSMAYVLLHHLRNKHLKQTQFDKAQFDTIRLKLFKIAASVRELSTKIKIQLPESYPYRNDFELAWRSCYAAGHL